MECKLLIVDDKNYLRKRYLGTLIGKVTTSKFFKPGTHTRALSILRTEDIDILVTDVRMPKIGRVRAHGKSERNQ